MPSLLDTQKITICPGEGLFTRGAGRVAGTSQGEQFGMEWQWAQAAMFAYFYPDFKARYPSASFVLAEGEYARMLTGITNADALLDRLRDEFRRDVAAGGALRPDILGFCARPPERGDQLVLELLEVSTARQAVATLTDDIGYKMNKFEQIIRGLDPSVKNDFSLTSYTVKSGPSKWRPQPMYQRIVPLPLRVDPATKATLVEWICFQPTFNRNWPYGIDGLLLYEIHSMRLDSAVVPVAVLTRMRDQEERQRRANQTSYGTTLVPWATQGYFARVPKDRDALLAFAAIGGIALLVAAAFYLAPVVAGLEIGGLLAGVATGATESTAGGLLAAAGGISATMATAGQWLSALGRPVLLGPTPAGFF